MESTTYETFDRIRAFLQEKRYLQNVSPRTIILYESCFKAFENAIESIEAIKERVVALRSRGVSPVTVNTYLRHIKCYYLWQGKEWKLPWLKEEKTLLHTLSTDSVSTLLRYKAVGTNLNRARMVALTILDTGLRCSECITLTKHQVDMDNLVIRVKGKGGKHRLVPFTVELRKHLYRYIQGHNHNMVFATKTGTPVSVRNIERDMKELGDNAGIRGVRFSPHTLRHTFAVIWICNGGDLFLLSRTLGHSSIKTTEIYLRSLGIEDAKKVHSQVSPLAVR